MNVFNTIKIMGILLLATVALTACNKQEGKVAARDCSTWQYQLASCSKEEMKETAWKPKPVQADSKMMVGGWRCSWGDYAYFPDNTYVEHLRLKGNNSTYVVFGGRYNVVGDKIFRSTGSSLFLQSENPRVVALGWVRKTGLPSTFVEKLFALSENQYSSLPFGYMDKNGKIDFLSTFKDGKEPDVIPLSWNVEPCVKDEQIYQQFSSFKIGMPE